MPRLDKIPEAYIEGSKVSDKIKKLYGKYRVKCLDGDEKVSHSKAYVIMIEAVKEIALNKSGDDKFLFIFQMFEKLLYCLCKLRLDVEDLLYFKDTFHIFEDKAKENEFRTIIRHNRETLEGEGDQFSSDYRGIAKSFPGIFSDENDKWESKGE